MIAPPIATAINDLAGKLGYLPVDAEWGTPGRPADPRNPDTIRRPGVASGGGRLSWEGPLEEWLRSRVESAGDRFSSQWESCAADKFLVVSRAASGGSEAQWLVDLAARTVMADVQADDGDDVMWSILGSPQTWQAVLGGQVNLHVAMRRNDLRYCSSGDDGPLVSQTRVAMLTDLFGLGSWPQAATADPAAGAAATSERPSSASPASMLRHQPSRTARPSQSRAPVVPRRTSRLT